MKKTVFHQPPKGRKIIGRGKENVNQREGTKYDGFLKSPDTSIFTVSVIVLNLPDWMKSKIQVFIVYKWHTRNIPTEMKQWKIKGQEKLAMQILIKIELG